MKEDYKLPFNRSDVYHVLISMDFNECIQFAQEYMDYKDCNVRYKDISEYPKMYDLYLRSKTAYKKSVEEENMSEYHIDYPFDLPTDEDWEDLKYHVIETGWFWCVKGLRKFIKFVYEEETDLIMNRKWD